MHCHISPSTRLTRKEKAIVREYNFSLENENFRRYIKLSIAVLHEKFGFGHDRVAEFLQAISEASSDAVQDEVFWRHVDDIIIKELKLTDWPRENYDRVDR